MFSKSRRLIIAYSFYFFSIGALDAYARCMEEWETELRLLKENG